MNDFTTLTSRSWATDPGYRQVLASAARLGLAGAGERLQHHKQHYPLWQLLGYLRLPLVLPTLAYFRLPADTVAFLQWVYQSVVLEDVEQLAGHTAWEGPMQHLPYAHLYRIWQRTARTSAPSLVRVYLEYATDWPEPGPARFHTRFLRGVRSIISAGQ